MALSKAALRMDRIRIRMDVCWDAGTLVVGRTDVIPNYCHFPLSQSSGLFYTGERRVTTDTLTARLSISITPMPRPRSIVQTGTSRAHALLPRARDLKCPRASVSTGLVSLYRISLYRSG